MDNQLLFIHIKNFNNFSPFSLNLTNDFEITFDKSSLFISASINRVKKILGSNITDINVIAGENGVGKTTLLKKLASIIASPGDSDVIDSCQYLLVYKIESKKLLVINNLDSKEIKHELDSSLSSFQVVRDADNYGPYKSIIYYSPFLDFNLLEVVTRYEENPIIDISQTQFLLKDMESVRKDAFENPLYVHKTANISRQLQFVKEESKKLDIPFKIPDKVDIKFIRFFIEKNDVSIEAKMVFETLQESCARVFREYPKNKMTKTNIAKLIFLRNLLSLYFSAINEDKSHEALQQRFPDQLLSKIKKSDQIDGLNLIKLILSFFREEDYFGADIYKVLVDEVFLVISRKSTEIFIEGSKNDLYIKVDLTDSIINSLLGLISLNDGNELYHKFTVPQLSEFISFDWSNVSSGEKGFLDVFSRLTWAKTQLKDKKGTVLLLIDEGEVGFHPSWQLQYIWYLKIFLNSSMSDFKVQVLLASHSPLVLSDLPKNRVLDLQQKSGQRVKLR